MQEEFNKILLYEWNKKKYGCDKKMYPKLVLNRLKVIKGPNTP